MAKQKHPSKKKPLADQKFLKNLQAESEMHDDHGPVIIGRREKKPKIPEDENSEK